MSILKNNIKNNFTIIQNEIFNYNISPIAFKLYIYLLSRPDNWKIYNEHVAKKLNISEKTLIKCWKELINNKLISRIARKDEQNKFLGGYDYNILLICPETYFLLDSANSLIGENYRHNNIDINNNKTNSTNNINMEGVKIVNNKIYDNFNYSGFNEQETISIKKWFQYREEIKKRYKTNSSLSALRNKLLDIKNNSSIVDAIENSIAMGYTGIFDSKKYKDNKIADLVKDSNKYNTYHDF